MQVPVLLRLFFKADPHYNEDVALDALRLVRGWATLVTSPAGKHYSAKH
jgi:hypothetical protein